MIIIQVSFMDNIPIEWAALGGIVFSNILFIGLLLITYNIIFDDRISYYP